MTISSDQVQYVALLARLKLNEDERNRYAEQLGAILNYVDKLNELDTDNIEPLAHILPIYNIFRKDETKSSPAREEILSNAPLTEEGQFKVPKII
jgi:aspartyl-tRNA(Asn)/glutamyl-tRNA(Gln) amidotransferase subunit C